MPVRQLYKITNIPRKIAPDQLKTFIENEFGILVRFNLPLSLRTNGTLNAGKNRGYAFVIFERDDDGENFLNSKTLFKDLELQIHAVEPTTQEVQVLKRDGKPTKEMLEQYFSVGTNILDIKPTTDPERWTCKIEFEKKFPYEGVINIDDKEYKFESKRILPANASKPEENTNPTKKIGSKRNSRFPRRGRTRGSRRFSPYQPANPYYVPEQQHGPYYIPEQQPNPYYIPMPQQQHGPYYAPHPHYAPSQMGPYYYAPPPQVNPQYGQHYMGNYSHQATTAASNPYGPQFYHNTMQPHDYGGYNY